MQNLSSSFPSVVFISYFPNSLGENNDVEHRVTQDSSSINTVLFLSELSVSWETPSIRYIKTRGKGHLRQALRKGLLEQHGPEGKETGISGSPLCSTRNSKVLAPSPKKIRACFIQCKQSIKEMGSITTTQDLHYFLNS